MLHVKNKYSRQLQARQNKGKHAFLWMHLFFIAITLHQISLFTAEYTFVIHHFLGPTTDTHTQFIQPWAKKVEAESDGRIRFEIFPSMSMGGKPSELYTQVRNGVADIVWTLPSYTPGIFKRVEVFELPEVHTESAKVSAMAIQEIFPLLAEDFKHIHPLLVYVHAGNALHVANKNIQSWQDLQGLKIRTPSRTGAWMIQAWGAEPVNMPLPELPHALSKGLVDAALIPFQVIVPFKIHELTRYSIEGFGKRRFGTSVFLFAMNKDRYHELPVDLQQIINKNSGKNIAQKTGMLWDKIETSGKKAQLQTGSAVLQLQRETVLPFNLAAAKVTKRWIDKVSAYGIDGEELLARAKQAIKKHSP